jgi:hypothetical protein
MLPIRMNVTSSLVVIDEGLSSQFVLSSARVGAASSAQLHAGIHSKQNSKVVMIGNVCCVMPPPCSEHAIWGVVCFHPFRRIFFTISVPAP